MNLRLEPRTDAPRWFSAAMTLGALAFAFVLSGFIIWLVGGDPVDDEVVDDAAVGGADHGVVGATDRQ